MWDATLASHLGAGSTGNALNAAGSSGDPWATALPGAYGAGSAGLLLGTTIPADLATITADIVALPTPPSAATILATAMPESYSAKGGTKTLAQVLYEIAALVGNFKISGTTMSLIALDGVTVKETLTLDSNTAPTTITRTT